MIFKIHITILAQYLGAQLYGNKDIVITNIASISKARPGHVTFLKDHRFRNKLSFCSASAVIVSENNVKFCQSDAVLVVKNPYLAYVKTAQLMNINYTSSCNSISHKAIIHPNVILGKKVGIGVNVIIESGVVVGDNVIIGSGSFVGKNVKIGIGSYLWSNVTIHHEVEIGEYCVVQSGAVIGSDGFGYIKDNNFWIKIPQLGQVKIGNYVEIGSCTTIDRGSLDNTCIENGVIIDNQCQIAHNVVIGEYTAIAGGVIIAGSVTIGKHCMIGGASVINGHINICDKSTITGMSMIIKSIMKPGIYSSGMPAQSNFLWRRNTILIMRIVHMNKRIKIIEKKLKYFYLYYFKILGTVCLFILLGIIGFLILMQVF